MEAKKRIECRRAATFGAILAGLFFWSFSTRGSDAESLVQLWLSRQTNIQTWAADFTQTRTLKSLTRPLVSTGEVWFAAPQNFRWEVGGKPPQTIALRNGDLMLVLYPRLKRAERYEFAQAQSAQWKDTLALLQTGFPRSKQEMETQFILASLQNTNQLQVLTLQPRSAAARKNIPSIKILLDPEEATLRGTELEFADGSTMRNTFTNIRTNVPLDPEFFATNIPPAYKITEPLRSPK
jgi:outer membrane lipoprotein-sorting protein